MADGLYLFLVCWLLAQVEIQIEGPHGWAERLPTWRISHPRLLAWTNGKPLTGYHLWLTAFLVAVFHLPLLWAGWSRELEAKILAFYFLCTVTWDFQWFAWNPAWGPRRFFSEKVWWFPRRWLGFPSEYYLGAASSFLATVALWPQGVGWWLRTFAAVLVASAASAALRLRP